MRSKELTQATNLEVDSAGMRGEVVRRDVAEAILRTCPTDRWAEGERREAHIQYLVKRLTDVMNKTYSQDFIAQHLPHVPPELQAELGGLPKYICVSPGGGRDAKHVMTIRATRQDWQNNAQLKGGIAEATAFSRDGARRIDNMLQAGGADTIEELCSRSEAA